MNNSTGIKSPFNFIVIVAALGYFVDIYDLILFSIVRIPSLKEIGVPDDMIKNSGIYLLNMQMAGMLVGGIVWGVLGDKKGRLSVLFMTILLYSLANIANGFVHTLPQYAWLRLIAGFGLAGELGVGITLVSEVMDKESRGLGTTIVSGIGIAGAALAFYIAELGWRHAYWAGGILGLLLLGMRVYVHESGLFNSMKIQNVSRGNFFSLFSTAEKIKKYIFCILTGIPIWFVVSTMVTFSKEFGEALTISEPINSGKAVMYHYIGLSIGSFAIGLLSQWMKSRKKSVVIALIFLSLFMIVFFFLHNASATLFYLTVFLLGITLGYWAMFVTIASEQFGTNIRSTVTTTVPNFVRGAVVPITLIWNSLATTMGILKSAEIVGVIVILLGFISIFSLKETYGKDLNYIEES